MRRVRMCSMMSRESTNVRPSARSSRRRISRVPWSRCQIELSNPPQATIVPASATSARGRSRSGAPSGIAGVISSVVLGAALSPSMPRRSPGRSSSSRCGAPLISLEQARRKFCAGFAYAGIRSVSGSDATESVQDTADLAAIGLPPAGWSPTAGSSPLAIVASLHPAPHLKAVRSSPRSTPTARRAAHRSEVTRAHHRPEVAFSDERLPNGLRVIVAEDHLAPVVAVNLWYDVGSKHEVPGKTGFAHLFEHVMFQGSRHVAKAEHIALVQAAGGTMNGIDLAGSDELLRDAAGAPARARAVARGGPDGDPARRAQPGEPRQPARGRQEREALVVRQPAVRVVAGEAPGPPVPAGPPVPPLDDRVDGRPRRRLARGRQRVLPDLLRAEQRRPVGRRRRRHRPTSGPRPSATSAAIPAEPGHPAPGRPVAAADPRRRDRRETVYDRVPLPRVHVGFRAPVFGDPRLDALDVAGQILAGGKGSRLNRRLVRDERIAQDVALFTLGFVGGASVCAGWATVRPGVAVARVEAAFHRGARAADHRARQRRRAGPGQGADRGGRARRAPAGRGARRSAVDVRDAVRRPGPHQPDAAALPGGHARRRSATWPPRSSGRTTASS